jgi:hypothetical protein
MMRLMWVVDVLAPNRLAGWAYHPESPHAHIEIVIQLRGELIAQQKAERLRPDLQKSRIGHGDHGFDIEISPHIAAADLPDLVITAVGADQGEHVLPLEAQKWSDSLSTPAPAVF